MEILYNDKSLRFRSHAKMDHILVFQKFHSLSIELLFKLPQEDCILLPIVHSSSEELAHYIFCEVIRSVNSHFLCDATLGESVTGTFMNGRSPI
jgi:hypothetical protein